MFELFAKLIDWTTSLLAWLSEKQVHAAKSRIRFCNSRIKKWEKTKEQSDIKIQNIIISYENERDQMQAFIDQEYKEL